MSKTPHAIQAQLEQAFGAVQEAQAAANKATKDVILSGQKKPEEQEDNNTTPPPGP